MPLTKPEGKPTRMVTAGATALQYPLFAGLQGLLWTETIVSWDVAEYQMFPRLVALAGTCTIRLLLSLLPSPFLCPLLEHPTTHCFFLPLPMVVRPYFLIRQRTILVSFKPVPSCPYPSPYCFFTHPILHPKRYRILRCCLGSHHDKGRLGTIFGGTEVSLYPSLHLLAPLLIT